MPATLAAAQEQLHRRRRQRRQERIAQQLPVYTDTHGRSLLPISSPRTSSETYRPGWESQVLAHSMRASQTRQEARQQRDAALTLSWLPSTAACHGRLDTTNARRYSSAPSSQGTFAIHPDLAVAMLRQNLVAPGRLWHLLRHLDSEGCGWVALQRARQQLTSKDSHTRICGWRQLRNLLAQGEGIFWTVSRHDASPDRIWLRSTARVAMTLGIARLSNKPVAVPLATLLGNIGAVRAHFFASFHSGRDSEKPIARETLAKVTGVSRRTQRAYEEIAGVEKQHNWAVGNEYSKAEVQQRAWQQGRAVFQLKDYQGKVGSAGRSYVAWQMPNSYRGPHAALTANRKKRINQELTDLSNKGMTGNGEQTIEEPASGDTGPAIRYYEHGRAAARSYNRNPGSDHYWRAPAAYRRCQVWHVLFTQKAINL